MNGPGKSNKTAAPQTSPRETRAPAPAHLVATLAATPLGRLAETIRTSPVMQARTAAVTSAFGAALHPNRTGLPDALKAGVEAASGLSMDDVRVTRNSSKPARLQALAYAQGTEIHLGPGQEKHLPHEAWHVAQQKQGRVKPTLQMKGVVINDDGALEREADRIGAEIARAKVGERPSRSAQALVESRSSEPRSAPIQRQWIEEGRGFFRWSMLRGGLRWRFNAADQKLAFDVVNEKALPKDWLQRHGGEVGVWQTHQQWIERGEWGPEPLAEAKDAKTEDTFRKLAEAGRSTYQKSIAAARQRGTFALPAQEQERRTAAFQEKYKTTPSKQDPNQVESVLNERTATDKEWSHGEYRNTYSPTQQGVEIAADHNYASKTVKEPISNSEIMFHQLAGTKPAQGLRVTRLARKHVSGDALKPLTAICKYLGVDTTTENADFTNGTEGFYALLSLANAKAAMWLVADHGEALSIRDISSITILKGKSLLINFAGASGDKKGGKG